MKKLVADPSKCTGCKICEKTCSMAFYKEENSLKSAIRIVPNSNGSISINVCDQCGVCKQMCQIMALKSAKSGVILLDKKTCVGCLVCVGECLRDYMYYNDELPTPFKCIACGLCVKECPTEALKISEDHDSDRIIEIFGEEFSHA